MEKRLSNMEPGDDYPYKRLTMTEKEIRDRFARLRKYKLAVVNNAREYRIINLANTVRPFRLLFRGKPVIAKVELSSYDEYDNISDYFNESVRVRCKRYDQKISSHEYWEQNKTAIIAQFPADSHSQREYLYKNYYECTTFKPSMLVGIAKYLCEEKPRILDISSGWGDRLIGAIAIAECYAGCDPNTNLFPGYAEIIKFFCADPKKFTVAESTFQEMKLPEWKPNLVLTSPPYFNLEEYSGAKVTSTLDEWLRDFLLASLTKASNALADGGHLVININDSKDIKFVHRMLNFNLPNMIFLGCIAQAQFDGAQPKSPQPFWVWKKVQLPADLNPHIVITEHEHEGKKFRVVRDDMLLGGTKQRVMNQIYSAHPEGIIYPGPAHGFAQVALALGAKLNNSRTTVLIPKWRPPTAQTILASQLGADIIEFEGTAAILGNMREIAKKMAVERKLYMPRLGFEGEEFKANMRAALKESLDLDRSGGYEFWVVGGSGTLALTLLDEFPSAHVNVVQVGKQIDWYFKGNPRATLYIAPEKFNDAASDLPPYPSLDTYDAKLWQFAKGKISDATSSAGTIIWNVACEAAPWM